MTEAQTSIKAELLTLLKNSLEEKTPEEFNTKLWPEIKAELISQAALLLVSDAVALSPLDNTEKNNQFLFVAQSLKKHQCLLNMQKEICEVLSEASIPVVVLKGAAAAMYYRKPMMRPMGDVDIIVPARDYERAAALLVEKIFTEDRKNLDTDRHIEFHSKEGYVAELHARFSSGNNKEQNKNLDAMIEDGIAKRETTEVGGFTVPVLPTLENGLVLLAHINNHLSKGLGLRQIVDWNEYVNKCLDDELWKQSFCEATEKIGMKVLAETVTFMCKKYLCVGENVSWCDHADENLADELMDYVIMKGNFGKKYDKVKRNSMVTIKKTKNPFKFLAHLQRTGMTKIRWKEKSKILIPVAWLLQLCHLIKTAITRKGGMKVFSEEIKKSNREEKMLKKLGVTNI